MTAPAYAPVQYEAPPVNPSTTGLYLVSAMIDLPEDAPIRILSGVDVFPRNCDPGWGTWSVEPCAIPEEGVLKSGQRAVANDPFEPLEVWGYDECDPTEPVDEIQARALQNLRLHEQGLLEAHFAARLLADAAPVSVPDLVAAIGELEVALGESGTTGVIHLSQRYSSALDAAGVSVGTGPIPRTKLGNALAFGGGYDAVLGSTLVATGPTTVWRSPVFQQDTVSPEENLRAAVAERTLVAGYECLHGAVTVGGA